MNQMTRKSSQKNLGNRTVLKESQDTKDVWYELQKQNDYRKFRTHKMTEKELRIQKDFKTVSETEQFG